VAHTVPELSRVLEIGQRVAVIDAKGDRAPSGIPYVDTVAATGNIVGGATGTMA